MLLRQAGCDEAAFPTREPAPHSTELWRAHRVKPRPGCPDDALFL
jgi:hypothetical protein